MSERDKEKRDEERGGKDLYENNTHMKLLDPVPNSLVLSLT